MRGGREHRHVHPKLGDHALGRALAHPGDGVEPIPGRSERDHQPVTLGVELGDRPFQLLKVLQGQTDEERVVGAEPAP